MKPTTYVRYVDDSLLFADDKDELHELKDAARRKLAESRLLLHEAKSRVYPVAEGIPFLGFRVFPAYRRLLPDPVKRARRRLHRLEGEWSRGEITIKQVRASVGAWIAHASHGETIGLRRVLLGAVSFRAGDRKVGAGRVLGQQSRERRVRGA